MYCTIQYHTCPIPYLNSSLKREVSLLFSCRFSGSMLEKAIVRGIKIGGSVNCRLPASGWLYNRQFFPLFSSLLAFNFQINFFFLPNFSLNSTDSNYCDLLFPAPSLKCHCSQKLRKSIYKQKKRRLLYVRPESSRFPHSLTKAHSPPLQPAPFLFYPQTPCHTPQTRGETL